MSFFWGGGLMHRIKIPQQDFVLKTQRGGVFAGHYNISSLSVSISVSMSPSYTEEKGCNYVIAMTFQDQEVQIQAKRTTLWTK